MNEEAPDMTLEELKRSVNTARGEVTHTGEEVDALLEQAVEAAAETEQAVDAMVADAADQEEENQ